MKYLNEALQQLYFGFGKQTIPPARPIAMTNTEGKAYVASAKWISTTTPEKTLTLSPCKAEKPASPTITNSRKAEILPCRSLIYSRKAKLSAWKFRKTVTNNVVSGNSGSGVRGLNTYVLMCAVNTDQCETIGRCSPSSDCCKWPRLQNLYHTIITVVTVQHSNQNVKCLQRGKQWHPQYTV